MHAFQNACGFERHSLIENDDDDYDGDYGGNSGDDKDKNVYERLHECPDFILET